MSTLAYTRKWFHQASLKMVGYDQRDHPQLPKAGERTHNSAALLPVGPLSTTTSASTNGSLPYATTHAFKTELM